MTEEQQNDIAEAARVNRVNYLAEETITMLRIFKENYEARLETLRRELPDLRCEMADFADIVLSNELFSFLGQEQTGFAKNAVRQILVDSAAVDPKMRRGNGWIFSVANASTVPEDEEHIPTHAELVNDNAIEKWENFLDEAFASAPVMEDAAPDQNPAVEADVRLRGGALGVGSLSRAGHGLLRFMVVGRTPNGDTFAVEHFFDHDAISSIAIVRAMAKTPPKSALFQG